MTQAYDNRRARLLEDASEVLKRVQRMAKEIEQDIGEWERGGKPGQLSHDILHIIT